MIVLLQIQDSTKYIDNQSTESSNIHLYYFWMILSLTLLLVYYFVKKQKKVNKQKKKNKEYKEKQILSEIFSKDLNQSIKVKKIDENIIITNINNEKSSKSEVIQKPIKLVAEEEIKAKDKEKENVKEIKRIGYKPTNNFKQKEPYSYPVVKFPNENAPIKFPRNGRSNKKGFKEDDFFVYLTNYFSKDFKVFNDKHIPQQNNHRPYEPDFILLKETNNDNIFINIEIDEPYEGLSKTPTHIISQDIYRDLFFINRGYIVIRFTEKQIHLRPLDCCSFIASVIQSIVPNVDFNNLRQINKLLKEDQWDSLKAKKWANEKYRENYLGIDNFGIREDSINEIKSINSDEDELIESLITNKTLIKKDKEPKDYLEKEHSHPRDKRIYFEVNEHRYLIDNNPDTISVSQLIDRFFPEFDSLSAASNLNVNHEYYGMDVHDIVTIWKENGLEKANLGTVLHTEIENYYNKKEFKESTTEFIYFKNFINRYPTMNPFRTEWRIFDEDLMIAGTIDMVYKKENGEYYMFDWKRSEKVVDNSGNKKLSDPSHQYTKFASGELGHLTDDSYNKYLLQQNIYRQILEKKYAIKISSMSLLILHPKYDNYHLVNLPKLENEINYIFEISKLIK
jgi:very-short-patch-repair endonuclease